MPDFDTDVLVTDRRRSAQRRTKPDRRPARPVRDVAPEPDEDVRIEDPGISARREILDRRRQDRRRQIDPTTCERDYSDGEIEFMRAMDDYKRKSGRPFPTWSEVLEVVMSLGYRKVADPSTLEWRTFGDQMGSL